MFYYEYMQCSGVGQHSKLTPTITKLRFMEARNFRASFLYIRLEVMESIVDIKDISGKI